MALRGGKLREHILWAAKDVFLEMGFERSSMDEVARRAETSKRTLYAHFESKEKLFLAVIELVRGLFLVRVGQPGDYSHKPAEALAVFCGRCLKFLLYKASIQMMRISMAEADRFPEQATAYFDTLFTDVQARIADYLKATFHISPRASVEAAERLLARVLYPRLYRCLFGIDPASTKFDPEGLLPAFDLKPIRKAVTEILDSFKDI